MSEAKSVKKIEVKEARKVKKFSMPISINIIFLALGVCLVIWADDITTLISILIGATFLVCAAYNFIAYARIENRNLSDQTKLVTAIALAVAGGFLVIRSGFIKEVISFIIGAFILIESIFRMQDALTSKKYNPNYKNALILSLVGIICGALCIFGKIIIQDTLLRVLGVILIVFAIVDAYGGIIVNQSVKAAKKVKSKVVE